MYSYLFESTCLDLNYNNFNLHNIKTCFNFKPYISNLCRY